MENVGNILLNFSLNAGLLATVIFFIKRWMTTMEKRADTNAENISTNRKEANEEIKNAIETNRQEYKERSNEIIKRLDDVCRHMEVANGRTAKLELKQEKLNGNLRTQIALCQSRNPGRRVTDAGCAANVFEEDDQ